MASLNQILKEVQEITARPDFGVLQLIKYAIRDAIRACHASSEFLRDLKSYSAPGFVASADGMVSIPLPPGFRKLHQDTPVRAVYADGCVKIINIAASGIQVPKDYFNFSANEYYTQFGPEIQVRYCGLPVDVQLVYFSYPAVDITAMTSDSWLIGMYDAAITYRAASRVFTAIGQDQDAVRYEQLFQIEREAIKDNHSHET